MPALTIRPADRFEILTADWQRTSQAAWLAECQLGPPPKAANREEFKDYYARYNDLAREILGRLN